MHQSLLTRPYFLQDDSNSTALTIHLPPVQACVCGKETFKKCSHNQHKLLFNTHFLCAMQHCSSVNSLAVWNTTTKNGSLCLQGRQSTETLTAGDRPWELCLPKQWTPNSNALARSRKSSLRGNRMFPLCLETLKCQVPAWDYQSSCHQQQNTMLGLW